MSQEILDTSILIDGCSELEISLSELQLSQLVKYYELLIETNKVMNLTAITEWKEVEVKHFLDSLLIVRLKDALPDVEKNTSFRVLDLGTGAGFPGIPLSIVFPDVQFTLADSLRKRVHFLDRVCEELKLSNVTTVHGRAEDLGRMKEFRETFDLVVSRAVANLSSLSEYCIPFVKVGGKFIAYKSMDIEQEYKDAKNAIRILGGEGEGITALPLPCSDLERSFVSIKKVRPTSGKYPRKAGTPGKEPL